MKHSSDLLLHFVGRASRTDPSAQRNICLSILRDGFRLSPQRVSFGLSIGSPQPLEYTTLAACFTDIPLRLAQGHIERYGACAIGIRKSLVKRWGGNPVLYLVDRTGPDWLQEEHKRSDLRGIFGVHMAHLARVMAYPSTFPEDHWIRALSDKQREAMKAEFSWILTHTKEMFDLGADVDFEDNSARRDRYYMEREWRVCLHRAHQATAEHPEGSRLVKKIGDSYYLPFPKRADARILVVPNDTVRHEIAETLISEGWTPSELPTLVTFDDSTDL